MIGTWLMLACVAAALFLALKAWRAWVWHHRGGGERKANIEYARMHREAVDTAEARLTKPEFIRYRVASRPGVARYVIAALLVLLLGLSASWALMTGWPWQ